MMKIKDLTNFSEDGVCFRTEDGTFKHAWTERQKKIIREACNLEVPLGEGKLESIVDEACEMIYKECGSFICVYEDEVTGFLSFFSYPETLENGLVGKY